MGYPVRGWLAGPKTASQSYNLYLMNVNSTTGRYAFDTDDAFTASEAPDDPFISFKCSPTCHYLHFVVKTADVLVAQKGWATLATGGGDLIENGLIEVSNLPSGAALFTVKYGFGFLDGDKVVVHLICDPPINPP